MNFLRIIPVLILAALLIPGLALSGSTGKIAGRVTDSQTGEPLPGANVVVEGTTFGSSTDLDGNYVVLNVPPGVYTVTASYIGYRRTQTTDVRVSVDFTTKVDFALQEGEIELETIVVQGERTPLIRKDLTNPVANITSETIDELPVTEIAEVIGLQAGVVVDDDGSIHIRGGYGNEISYTVNGVNVNNPYGNTRSVGLATNAVQEVSVSSGTFSAEYGEALSGVVNYVTKEGGSRLTGGFKYLTGDYLSNRTDLFPEAGSYKINNVYRFELSLGGPIVPNKLSFYGSGVYNYFGGSLYGKRLYMPTDSYLSRESFPTTDPRRGSPSDPYYFAPYTRSVSDPVGGPTGDGAIVPLNWRRAYNLQGNLVYRFTPEMKVKYEIVHDNVHQPSTSGNSATFANSYKPDGRRLNKSEGYFQSLDWTHVLSDRMFYTVKLSHVSDRTTSRTFDGISYKNSDGSYAGTDYLPSDYLNALGNTAFLTGGTDLLRFKQKTISMGGKVDLVAQMSIHELKVGVDFKQYEVTTESYTLQFKDPANPDISPNPGNILSGLYDFRPVVPTTEGGYLYYKYKPIQAAAYIQDKIELFDSIILNLGLRFNYFDPAADYNPDISNELSNQTDIFLTQGLKPATPKKVLQPRISVAFPITDQGTIRFSYGHFMQMGSLSSLYNNPEFLAQLGTSNPSFGNADVNPQRNTQYEVALQQGLTRDLKIDISAYYKDTRDYIYTQNIITARGDRTYSVLTNLAYANTRGISFSLVKRRAPGELLSATLDYTFQVGEMNRTQPTDEIFFNEEKGKLSETYIVPIGFDRSHTLTTVVSLSQPSDWGVSLIGYMRTGTPYTPSFPASVVTITFEQNSDRQPIQWNVDLKAEKFFKFGMLDFSVYMQVDNLFDTQNELSVYANSGRALFNIEETINPYQFAELRSRIARGDPGLFDESVMDNYYARPQNVSSPRLVRFGMSVFF